MSAFVGSGGTPTDRCRFALKAARAEKYTEPPPAVGPLGPAELDPAALTIKGSAENFFVARFANARPDRWSGAPKNFSSSPHGSRASAAGPAPFGRWRQRAPPPIALGAQRPDRPGEAA